ncbi:MAG: winged helix DNA-binding domain-containing protein [Arachnia sp.]
MVDAALGRRRLVAQRLITASHGSAAAVVADAGAMQGQDLPGVMASIALRLGHHDTDAVIGAFNDGTVVRGYPMRGTIFAVAAADLAWMTELCSGRISTARRRAQLGITDEVEAIARGTFESEVTQRGIGRADLLQAWQRAGIDTGGGRGYHLILGLMLAGHACYGAWNGTDQNLMPAGEWLPARSGIAGRFNGDLVAAAAELLRRYLWFRGPATLRDFAWWTKLPHSMIRPAFELIADDVAGEAGSYHRPGLDTDGLPARRPRLLPAFDEFVLGYPDRGFAVPGEHRDRLIPGNNGVFQPAVIVGGTCRGLWRRGGRPGKRSLVLEAFGDIGPRHRAALEHRFAEFPFVTA